MDERRKASRLRTNINVRWETLKTEGRGAICDLSSSGCFILTGGEVVPRELTRIDLSLPGEVMTFWGHVVYEVGEMGFGHGVALGSKLNWRARRRPLGRRADKAQVRCRREAHIVGPRRWTSALGVVDTQIAAIGARFKNLAPRKTRYIGAPTI